jgi:hypothetical protein
LGFFRVSRPGPGRTLVAVERIPETVPRGCNGCGFKLATSGLEKNLVHPATQGISWKPSKCGIVKPVVGPSSVIYYQLLSIIKPVISYRLLIGVQALGLSGSCKLERCLEWITKGSTKRLVNSVGTQQIICYQSVNNLADPLLIHSRHLSGLHDPENPKAWTPISRRSLITLVNTQNVVVTKIVDSPSIQCAESKYGLRIQFLALVVMIHEVWLNA